MVVGHRDVAAVARGHIAPVMIAMPWGPARMIQAAAGAGAGADADAEADAVPVKKEPATATPP